MTCTQKGADVLEFPAGIWMKACAAEERIFSTEVRRASDAAISCTFGRKLPLASISLQIDAPPARHDALARASEAVTSSRDG